MSLPKSPKSLKLNAEQKAAIATRAGAWVVVAAPGSGKTTVLTERIKQLFSEGAVPDNLLALTFTVSAAAEMAKRVGISVPKDQRGGYRTFHSFGLNLIKREARFLSHGLSADPFPAGSVLSKLLGEAIKKNGLARTDFDAARNYISRHKRARISPKQALDDCGPWKNPNFALTYQTYSRLLREAAILDFDDMILNAVELLEIPEVQERWQFKWVLCDEGQDTDDLQFSLLQSVSAQHGNIFCVGDFCQALYGFRGANPKNLLRFDTWFPGAKTLYLPTNYRSTQRIVSFCRSNAPIQNDLTDQMRTDNPEGAAVEFRMYDCSNDEAENVLAAAESDPGRSAILARTNSQLGLFESLCTERSVKFYNLGKTGFWHQTEVKQVVHLADFLLSPHGPKGYSHELVLPLRATIRSMSGSAAVYSIIDRANLESLYSSDDYTEDDNFAVLNLRSLVRIAERFRSLKEFLTHAHKASHASRKSKTAITLGTIHAAKGLEWDNVFVVGVQVDILPHKKGDLEEEKRIFYVAMSRAAKRLQITWAGTPSEFVVPHLTPEIKTKLRSNQQRLEKQESLFNV